jgi:hypothetical protein
LAGVRLCEDPGLTQALDNSRLAAQLRATQAGRAGLQDELTRLMTSQAAYRSAGQVMEVWGRQMALELPPNLLPTAILHCHLTGQLTTSMKVYRISGAIQFVLSFYLLFLSAVFRFRHPNPDPDLQMTLKQIWILTLSSHRKENFFYFFFLFFQI